MFHASLRTALALAAGALLSGLAPLAEAQVSTATLNGWSIYGDVVSTSGQIKLTTAYLDGLSTGDQPSNLSGTSATDIGTLETAAGVATYGLDLSPVQYGTEGSLVSQTFQALAGQTLSFTWSFSSLDTAFLDRAFVVIDGVVTTLATTATAISGSQTFRYALTSSAPVTLSFGVIDTVDVLGVSSLSVGNLQLVSAVPEPTSVALLLGGLIGLGGWQRARARAREAAAR